jgi:hypothetical protein
MTNLTYLADTVADRLARAPARRARSAALPG